MKSIINIQTLSILLSVFSLCAQAQSFKTIADIEQSLNPLEVITNHDGIKRSIALQIQFEINSAKINQNAWPQIEALGKALQKSPLNQCKLLLIGHTDASGAPDSNLTLSDARANAVKLSLVQSYTINDANIEASGEGDTQLLGGFSATDSRHRRVEIKLADIDSCRKIAQNSALSKNSKSNPLTDNTSSGNKKIDW